MIKFFSIIALIIITFTLNGCNTTSSRSSNASTKISVTNSSNPINGYKQTPQNSHKSMTVLLDDLTVQTIKTYGDLKVNQYITLTCEIPPSSSIKELVFFISGIPVVAQAYNDINDSYPTPYGQFSTFSRDSTLSFKFGPNSQTINGQFAIYYLNSSGDYNIITSKPFEVLDYR